MSILERLRDGGVIPPMITPLLPDGSIDVASTANLASALTRTGCTGVLILGSTGEGPCLSADAAELVVRTVRDATDGILMANVAAMSTDAAAAAARRWRSVGADVILAPPPSGLPISASELTEHYRAVAAAADGPVMAYHVPSRVPSALTPSLLGALVSEGILLGVKDSSGDLDNHRREAMAIAEAGGVGYSGSETCIDMAVLAGFTGSIPGLANVYPRTELAVLEAAREGRWPEARRHQEGLTRRMDLYFGPTGEGSFSATVMGTIKTALQLSGVIEHSTLSSPLTQPSAALRAHVEAHLAEFPAELG